jgi:hypothetical protein
MHPSVKERNLIKDPGGSRILWDLLDKYGSCELVIGLTTGEETLSLIQHVKSVTKGLLALNAVLVWENHFSLLTGKEILQWQKQFGVPFRGIDFRNQKSMDDFHLGLIPIGMLPTLLDEHGIQALLTYHPWRCNPFDGWGGEVVITSVDNSLSGTPERRLEKECEPALGLR